METFKFLFERLQDSLLFSFRWAQTLFPADVHLRVVRIFVHCDDTQVPSTCLQAYPKLCRSAHITHCTLVKRSQVRLLNIQNVRDLLHPQMVYTPPVHREIAYSENKRTRPKPPKTSRRRPRTQNNHRSNCFRSSFVVSTSRR